MTTVRALIERHLPAGTTPSDLSSDALDWSRIPAWPPDVFAVTAALVERSSAYRFVVAPNDDPNDGNPKDLLGVMDPEWRGEMAERARAWACGLLPFSESRAGEEWAKLVALMAPDLPDLSPDDRALYDASHAYPYRSWDELVEVDLSSLQDDWTALCETHGGEKIVPPTADLSEWWRPALRLMITADTASAGIGFKPRGWASPRSKVQVGKIPTWVQGLFYADIDDSLPAAGASKGKGPPAVDAGFRTTVTSTAFNGELGAVLPKTRTSSMGVTLRSLSHNLALLPPPGLVEARWRAPGVRPIAAVKREGSSELCKPLNLLLVPFPYRISPKSFVPHQGHPVEPGDWGYYHLRQTWLRSDGRVDESAEADFSRTSSTRELTNFVQDLMEKGCRELGEINGVVFPEFALDNETFLDIAGALRDKAEKTKFEFIVAGMSEQPREEGAGGSKPGNYAVFRGLERNANDGKLKDREWGLAGAREKHHRWKLNPRQIERYGLSSRLAVGSNWWEAIPVSRRVVEFFEVRAGTSMTVLICEDLARADPCQTVVRSIGPNLVLALLMDGPQRPFRWPGHYAGVLADDPGSSVLTLTSFGLVDRAAALDSSHSRSVAFFKDCLGAEVELQLPVDCHALAIRLEAAPKVEHTLDGRGDGGSAYIWRLREVCPVRGEVTAANNWIVG